MPLYVQDFVTGAAQRSPFLRPINSRAPKKRALGFGLSIKNRARKKKIVKSHAHQSNHDLAPLALTLIPFISIHRPPPSLPCTSAFLVNAPAKRMSSISYRCLVVCAIAGGGGNAVRPSTNDFFFSYFWHRWVSQDWFCFFSSSSFFLPDCRLAILNTMFNRRSDK